MDKAIKPAMFKTFKKNFSEKDIKFEKKLGR